MMRLGFLAIFIISLFANVSCNKQTNSKPGDFDAFWEETLIKLNQIPLEEIKIKKDTIIDNKKLSLFKIKSFQDIYFYAWISEPTDIGKYPVFIRFSGFGEGTSTIDSIPHLWFLNQEKRINIIVDIRGQGLSTEQIKFENYLTNGITNHQNYIYRGAYMDAVRAVDFAAKNSNSDGNIIVMGGSQGGALSIAATALNNKITMCIIGFPFLTNINNYDKKKWPMNILIHYVEKNKVDYFDLKHTLSYFDILNFGKQIKVPFFIKTEEIDEVTPLNGAIKLFNEIDGQKKMMYVSPCKGHGCVSNSTLSDDLEKAFIKNNLLKN